MTAAAKVLIVEDERIVALDLQRRMQHLGYEVPATAATSAEALRKVAETHPDLVLLDINIQGPVDGIDTAHRIRAAFDTPVIYLTAYSEEQTLARARETRPYGYLLKSYSDRELRATLEMALERRKTEQALAESEQRLRLAREAADLASRELDGACRGFSHPRESSAVAAILAQTFAESGEEFLDRAQPGDRKRLEEELRQALADNVPFAIELCTVLADGKPRCLKLCGRSYAARDGQGLRVIGVVRDVTAQRAAHERLQQAATVFECTQEGIFVLDGKHRLVSMNPAFSAMTGVSTGAIGHPARIMKEKTLGPDAHGKLWASVEGCGSWAGEIRALRMDGTLFPAWLALTAVRDDAQSVANYVGVLADITALKEAQAKLERLANHDALTGLPNRMMAMDRIDHALTVASRRRAQLALLVVNLDGCKQVNDPLDHQAGDQLLREASKRLRACLRASDTAGRLGGDQFLVILEQLDRDEDAAVVAEKLTRTLADPFTIGGRPVSISGSVGIALYPRNAASREGLLQSANAAMHTARQNGRNRFAYYSSDMTTQATRYLAQEREMRRALQNSELVLHYQPILQLPTGWTTGVEALVRWQHPVKGLLGAAEVIPIAERSELILDIGEWALATACTQARDWNWRGMPLQVAVNVSPRQLKNGTLLTAVQRALKDSRLPAERLEIEITENALHHEPESVAVLDAISRLGVTIAIDDFGTGYSCLASLKDLPLRRLKVDRALVQDVPRNSQVCAITDAIIAMGHLLSLQVTAEGVETPGQIEFLRTRCCDSIQGHVLSRAVPASEIASQLAPPRSAH